MSPRAMAASPYCPSAQPEMEGVVAFGVVGGSAAEPRVGYLDRRMPVTPELLALTGTVPPAEVFRFGAPCAGTGCRHFDGDACRLASKLVQLAPVVGGSALPACTLRPDCRWWRQEGKAACMRCPQVVTIHHLPSDEMRYAADPGV
ncbi:MAG TPA: hypothetical protein VLK84_16565 [Longimicrobium sp.]|nr:hypothetical protein [Longimicrobium sp.]